MDEGDVLELELELDIELRWRRTAWDRAKATSRSYVEVMDAWLLVPASTCKAIAALELVGECKACTPLPYAPAPRNVGCAAPAWSYEVADHHDDDDDDDDKEEEGWR